MPQLNRARTSSYIGIVTYHCVIWFAFSALLLSAQTPNDQLSNERFPVDYKRLEKHWGVDCEEALNVVGTWFENFEVNSNLNQNAIPISDLERCGLLFNTRGTDRFKPCPDYQEILNLLDSFTIQPDKAAKIRFNQLTSEHCQTTKKREHREK